MGPPSLNPFECMWSIVISSMRWGPHDIIIWAGKREREHPLRRGVRSVGKEK